MDGDLMQLQGWWRQVTCDADGVQNVTDEYGPVVATFLGTRFVVHGDDGGIVLEGDFVIDASTDPKSIDWIDSIGPDAGKRLPAIYRLDGDDFSFVAADEGSPRPRVFVASAGETMRRFVRLREP